MGHRTSIYNDNGNGGSNVTSGRGGDGGDSEPREGISVWVDVGEWDADSGVIEAKMAVERLSKVAFGLHVSGLSCPGNPGMVCLFLESISAKSVF